MCCREGTRVTEKLSGACVLCSRPDRGDAVTELVSQMLQGLKEPQTLEPIGTVLLLAARWGQLQ